MISNQKNEVTIRFYIEPLLADKLNSTKAIGNLSEYSTDKEKRDYEKYKQFYENTLILSKSSWLQEVLPQRIISNLAKD